MLLVSAGYAYMMIELDASNPSESQIIMVIVGSVIGFTVLGQIMKRAFFGSLHPNPDKLLQNGGERAKAKVINIQDTGTTINTIYFVISLTVEVHPGGLSPFQSTFEATISRLNIPKIGDEITVIFDPNNYASIMMDPSQAGVPG